jgi:hypothetical protein
VVEDFVLVDSNAEFPYHRVFRPTGRDVTSAVTFVTSLELGVPSIKKPTRDVLPMLLQCMLKCFQHSFK